MEVDLNREIAKAVNLVGSQAKLAELCGVSHTAVKKWLKGGGIDGKHLLSIEQATEGKVTIREICEALKDAQNA